MSDKEVQRNVRSTSEEGVKTPAQKHENLASHDSISFGEHVPAEAEVKKKQSLLQRFREREQRWQEEPPEEHEKHNEKDTEKS